jgi:hypothetical protein
LGMLAEQRVGGGGATCGPVAESRAVPARLGPEAPALAWPERASALDIIRPSQSRQVRPGSGLAWPRPGLLYERCDTTQLEASSSLQVSNGPLCSPSLCSPSLTPVITSRCLVRPRLRSLLSSQHKNTPCNARASPTEPQLQQSRTRHCPSSGNRPCKQCARVQWRIGNRAIGTRDLMVDTGSSCAATGPIPQSGRSGMECYCAGDLTR